MPAGIYLHIPFCARGVILRFCDRLFKSEAAVERYVSALAKEIENFSQKAESIETIYFGGGTPSLLAPGQLGKILNSFTRNFRSSR